MKNSFVAVLAFVVTIALSGCASRSSVPVPIGSRWTNTSKVALLPTPHAKLILLEARSRVELLDESGAFAKIQTADGHTGYVPLAVLDIEAPKEPRRRAARPATEAAAHRLPSAAPESDAPAFRL